MLLQQLLQLLTINLSISICIHILQILLDLFNHRGSQVVLGQCGRREFSLFWIGSLKIVDGGARMVGARLKVRGWVMRSAGLVLVVVVLGRQGGIVALDLEQSVGKW